MILLGPRPLLIGEANLALVSPRQYWSRSIPPGSPWRLKYLTVNYRRTTNAETGAPVQSGVLSQLTPDLLFTLFDSKGQAFQVRPVLVPQVTTPGGGFNVAATSPIDESYAGNDTVKLLIEGQRITGPNAGPAYVSFTFFGIRGWETMGGR